MKQEEKDLIESMRTTLGKTNIMIKQLETVRRENENNLDYLMMKTVLEKGLFAGEYEFVWFNTRMDDLDELNRSELKFKRMATYEQITTIFQTVNEIIDVRNRSGDSLWLHLDLEPGSEKPYHEKQRLEIYVPGNRDDHDVFARSEISISVRFDSNIIKLFKKYGIKITNTEKMISELEEVEDKIKSLKKLCKQIRSVKG